MVYLFAIFPEAFSTAALLFFKLLFLIFVGRIKYIIEFYIRRLWVVSYLLELSFFQFPDLIPRGATWKALCQNFSRRCKNNTRGEQTFKNQLLPWWHYR